MDSECNFIVLYISSEFIVLFLHLNFIITFPGKQRTGKNYHQFTGEIIGALSR